MKESFAFAPGHITGFFEICDSDQMVLRKGSRGAGVSIGHGVTTRVEQKATRGSQTEIFINGKLVSTALVSKRVIDIFLKKIEAKCELSFDVYHQIQVPIGFGLGSSGAGALSLSFALNSFFNAGLSYNDTVSIAHQAEIEEKTGLGTVMGEAYGGIEIREEPGTFEYGKLSRIEVESSYKVLCLLFGPLSTAHYLSDSLVRNKINNYGRSFVEKIIQHRSLSDFMLFSRDFSFHTGLVTRRLASIIEELDRIGIVAGMLMFGDGIFLIESPDNISNADEYLRRYLDTGQIILSEIDFHGVRLL